MLAAALSKARVERGWSTAELAKRVHLDTQHIRRLEAGVASCASVEAVACALELRLSHMPAAHSFGGQIEAQRGRRGLTISELAAASKLSRMTVRALIQGRGSLASMDRVIGVLAPSARLKSPPQASWHRVGRRSGDDQFTPREFIEKVIAIFGPIDLDPAWHEHSSVLAGRTISLATGGDGLAEEWPAGLVWLNPPFSELLRWLRKADEEWSSGRAKTIVSLVPARTDSTYFHDRLARVAHIYLLRRRLRFIQLDGRPGNQAPFSIMMVLFGATAEQRCKLQDQIPGLWVHRP